MGGEQRWSPPWIPADVSWAWTCLSLHTSACTESILRGPGAIPPALHTPLPSNSVCWVTLSASFSLQLQCFWPGTNAQAFGYHFDRLLWPLIAPSPRNGSALPRPVLRLTADNLPALQSVYSLGPGTLRHLPDGPYPSSLSSLCLVKSLLISPSPSLLACMLISPGEIENIPVPSLYPRQIQSVPRVGSRHESSLFTCPGGSTVQLRWRPRVT